MRNYTAKEATALVLRALDSGMSACTVAGIADISEDTVWSWRDGRVKTLKRRSLRGLERLDAAIRSSRRKR